MLGVASAFLNFSLQMERISTNPITGFRALKVGSSMIKFWDLNEAQSFLRFANQKYPVGTKTRWVYLAYLLTLNTGVRSGELWGFMPKDLHQSEDLLDVSRHFSISPHPAQSPRIGDQRTQHLRLVK